ncbi:uncharacterized protein LOC100393267 isoform X2 [Callithrix jacchus]
MVTGERRLKARLAALLPDLLVFRKPRGSEPEVATAQGVLLGVHVTGLSAGRISQVIVGDERQQYLLVIGRDVDDVQLAQRLAQANEIVLSWNCWMLCKQYMFEVEVMRRMNLTQMKNVWKKTFGKKEKHKSPFVSFLCPSKFHTWMTRPDKRRLKHILLKYFRR